MPADERVHLKHATQELGPRPTRRASGITTDPLSIGPPAGAHLERAAVLVLSDRCFKCGERRIKSEEPVRAQRRARWPATGTGRSSATTAARPATRWHLIEAHHAAVGDRASARFAERYRRLLA